MALLFDRLIEFWIFGIAISTVVLTLKIAENKKI